MGKLALRHRSASPGSEVVPDEAGLLHDPALRRAVVDLGGGGAVDVLEALAALRLAAKQLHVAMERFAERHGLSESRLRVLMRLHHSPGRQLPLGALADSLGVTPRTMTDVVDLLERDGLVKRMPDPLDRRSVLAVLTESGASRVSAMRREATRSQSEVAKGFTPDQIGQLRHLCLLLVRNLNEPVEA
jgi:DNA-binding MarR family transcriptional regulator